MKRWAPPAGSDGPVCSVNPRVAHLLTMGGADEWIVDYPEAVGDLE